MSEHGGNTEAKTQIVSFHIPRVLLHALDRLVEAGVFNNRSEAIRFALYRLLMDHNAASGELRRHMVAALR
ncbi:MAG: CopG family transcriptional regulator [Thermoprotei archaeon]|nr:MAG: CopG family transcriptional regulator [Thermoprotei archaeon]